MEAGGGTNSGDGVDDGGEAARELVSAKEVAIEARVETADAVPAAGAGAEMEGPSKASVAEDKQTPAAAATAAAANGAGEADEATAATAVANGAGEAEEATAPAAGDSESEGAGRNNQDAPVVESVLESALDAVKSVAGDAENKQAGSDDQGAPVVESVLQSALDAVKAASEAAMAVPLPTAILAGATVVAAAAARRFSRHLRAKRFRARLQKGGDGREPLRIGVIGCAGIARKNVAAIGSARHACEVVAVASRSMQKAKSFVKVNRLNASKVKAYDSYTQLLEDPAIDAVYMPLPTSMHARWVHAAALAGKHVLCEKPIATGGAEEVDAMLSACSEHDVVLQDGTMFTFDARWARVMGELENTAAFGEVRHVYASFSFCGDESFYEKNIRCDPSLDALGCLGDIGWYAIRAALRVYGWQAPRRVTGHGGCRRNSQGVLLSCGAQLDFGEGRTATIECAFDRALTQRVVITSDKSELSMDDAFVPRRYGVASYTVVSKREMVQNARRITQRVRTVTVRSALSQEARMWEGFAEACSAPNGEASGRAVLRAALTQRVVDAVDESLKEDTPVAVVPKPLCPVPPSPSSLSHSVSSPVPRSAPTGEL